MSKINKENVIDAILSISYEDWKKDDYDDTCIIQHYNCLREKIFDIFNGYDKEKEKKLQSTKRKFADFFQQAKNKKLLTDKLAEFQRASEALFLLNRVLLYNKNNNKKFERCFVATNTFISKLQNQYIFDISYHIQQKDGNHTMHIAFIALGFTVVFGIISILCTVFDWKYEKSDLPNKIECLSDSIKTLNGKIDQQNEIIEKYLQKNDDVTKSK